MESARPVLARQTLGSARAPRAHFGALAEMFFRAQRRARRSDQRGADRVRSPKNPFAVLYVSRIPAARSNE